MTKRLSIDLKMDLYNKCVEQAKLNRRPVKKEIEYFINRMWAKEVNNENE